ncbi:MAG: amidohydrolase family protein [Thermoguttaceae bacterium]
MISGQTCTRRTMLLRTAQAAVAVGAVHRWEGEAVAVSEENAERAIWDGHVHLAGVSGTVEERVDRLLAMANRVGIERLVVCMGTSFSQDPSPEELRKQNDEVLRAIAHAPGRILGMVYLNPKHEKASLDELDRCVRDGPMIGVKLWIALRCNRPELDPIVCRAVALNVPIFQHVYERAGGNLPGESSGTDLRVLAARHPDASLICAHVGNDWERGIRAIRGQKNIWADVSGSDPTAGLVEMAVRELGAERVVFGSDAGGRSFASQVAKVTSADLPEPAKRLILSGNLQRLLGPALAQKGAKR